MRGPAGGVAPISFLSSRSIRLIRRAMCKARFIARASLRRWRDGTATGWATPIQAFDPNEATQRGGLAACATPSRQRVIRSHWLFWTKTPPQKPTVAGFFSGLVGGWGTGGSAHRDQVIDHLQHDLQAAARHLAAGGELAGNAHCGNAFDAVNVLQLRCAARLVGDVEGVVELLELGGVQALLVRPGQDILVLVQLL